MVSPEATVGVDTDGEGWSTPGDTFGRFLGPLWG
jgi:hypothetical protein